MSSTSVDFQTEVDRLKASITISAIIAASVPLKRNGREFVACCPFHGEKTPSFSVNDSKGFYHCFGCGAHGDVFDWLAKTSGMSLPDAVRHLSGNISLPAANVVPLKPREQEEAEEWAAIVPVPDDAPDPPGAHPKHGVPVHIARYLDAAGGLVGLVFRCEPPGERRQVPTLTYCQDRSGARRWQWKSLPKPRSLYGAELLSGPGRILIVEGEPKCEAARRMLGDAMIVVAWPGGANAAQYAEWSLLAGRDCVIWPDADAPGRNAAAQIAIQLRHHGATARIVEPPDNATKGWDLGDAEREGWTGADVLAAIDPPEPDPEHYEPEVEREVEHFDFAPLGHDRGRFYFFTSGGGQVRDFSARDLQSIGSLCELAPLRYWEVNHPGKGDAGFNVRSAGDALVRACYRAGIYDVDRIRGRGAWIDEGRAVLHVGDSLIVDGCKVGLADIKTRYIYEAAKPLVRKHFDPLSTADANKLVGLCQAPTWQHGISGILFAGFVVVAPVCGGLAWRPSIWITGGAGSGKTWLKENILAPSMAGVVLLVQSKTSEAGIRQTLGCDALPVLFDEAEREDASAASRMQGVLDLLRQSSSEGGAEIVKGSQSQTGAKRYRIRSCFALSSINVGIEHQADESRITILALRDRDPLDMGADARFAEINRLVQTTLTPAFAAGLLARSVRLLPIIRTNAETFAKAVSVVFGSRRTGDQLGALLAGAYTLFSDRVITDEAAEVWVRKQDWGTAAGSEVERDELRLLSHLTQHRVRFSQGNGSSIDATIGRLLLARSGNDQQISVDIADIELKQIGIRYDTRDGVWGIFVSTNHPALKRILVGTPWSAGWGRALGRLPGAVTGEQKTIRFAFGHTGKAVWVPMEAVDAPCSSDDA